MHVWDGNLDRIRLICWPPGPGTEPWEDGLSASKGSGGEQCGAEVVSGGKSVERWFGGRPQPAAEASTLQVCNADCPRPSAERDRRPLLAEAGSLLERVGHLKDAKIVTMSTNDLDADRQPLCRESGRH